MPLPKGTHLGPYEVISPLGAGGMGEVYRARDSRLGRSVAIKLLPEKFAEDSDRVSRFEREARAASALSHASVVAVYDVGREGKSTYIVTEIVEGGTLRDLLDSGPMALRRALDLAAQIASGLSAAHEQGIVHRDLKPENILLTKSGEPKIADFGLAKLTATADGIDSQLPTRDNLNTSDGVVMGTVAYMSPEQASGRKLDFRSDQFAFGSILYEMLAGRSAFRRNTAAETLSAIIRDEPEPVAAINPAIPPSLCWILERCLAKNPDDRYASTRDLARELSHLREHLSDLARGPAASSVGAVSPASRRNVLPWAVAGIALVLAAATFAHFHRSPESASGKTQVLRFRVPPPAGQTFSLRVDQVELALSPDGSRLAFLAREAESRRDDLNGRRSPRMIWIRTLSDLDSHPLAGSEGAVSLFWSPDSRSIAFCADGRLKRIDLAGGSAAPVCDLPGGEEVSGTWGAGEIVFASTIDGVIYGVPADGGKPSVLVRPDPKRNETKARWPWFLPDGKRFLYLVNGTDAGCDLKIASPDYPPRLIAPISSRVEYADPGFLVFARDGGLFCQRFDPAAGRLTGPLRSLAPAVSYFYTNKWAGFAVSRGGLLAFAPQGNLSRLTWFDRAGRNLGYLGSDASGDILSIAISPDGKNALFDRTRSDLGTYDVWTIDLARGVETRVTSDPDSEFDPVWFPDGRHIIYSAVRQGELPRLMWRDLAGGAEKSLLPAGTFQEALGAFPDGSRLLFTQREPAGTYGLWTLGLRGDAAPKPLIVSKYQHETARLSPDGKLVAFISDESGQDEAYVQAASSSSDKIRVSTSGADHLRWGRDGKTIYFTSPGRQLFEASVKTSPSLEVGNAKALFQLPAEGWGNFDVTSDGRFLAIVQERSQAAAPLTVVANWTSDFKP